VVVDLLDEWVCASAVRGRAAGVAIEGRGGARQAVRLETRILRNQALGCAVGDEDSPESSLGLGGYFLDPFREFSKCSSLRCA
jgi:hypothetical protein